MSDFAYYIILLSNLFICIIVLSVEICVLAVFTCYDITFKTKLINCNKHFKNLDIQLQNIPGFKLTYVHGLASDKHGSDLLTHRPE